MNMEQELGHGGSVALIVGVTGMVGVSLAEALKKPSALGGSWKVYGAARRPLPSWFPSSMIDRYIAVDATDYDDTEKKLSPLSGEVTHVFWVALQVRETEEANVVVNSTMLKNVLDVLVRSSASPSLRHVSLQTGTRHYMGPIYDPIISKELTSHEPPFEEDFHRLPYPNFYYSLEDLLASYSPVFTYSVHRSSIIIGASTRSFYNTLLTLSVYATLCKEDGSAFRFPGTKYTWEHFCDMSDAGVLAEQQIWAGVTGRAKNQAFNCTNGDVFTWKRMWRVLCEIFEVEFVNFEDDDSERVDWVEEMMKKGIAWDDIVEKYGLFKTNLDEITCFDALNGALHFGFQHVCSMNKSREFGFFGCANKFKRVKFWVQRLREMKIIP